MKELKIFFLSVLCMFIPSLTSASCFNDIKMERKLNDIVFVVYCEDRTDIYASGLVMSTIYNRAESYDVSLLHDEVSKKNQYYCFNMKSKSKKIYKEKYSEVYDMVCDFITNERSPTTQAKYFYNYKLVRPTFARTRKVVLTYGSHVYLI